MSGAAFEAAGVPLFEGPNELRVRARDVRGGEAVTTRSVLLDTIAFADATCQRFEALAEYDRGAIIEFLKSLQILPPRTHSLRIDDRSDDTECQANPHGPHQ